MRHNDRYAFLLEQAQLVYQAHPALKQFADFPDDICAQPMEPFHLPSSDLLLADTELQSAQYAKLLQSIFDVAPAMRWREIYQDEIAHLTFMEKLACTSIIGKGAPFHSNKLRLFIVYMAPHLFYPWHSHPAEEIYMVLSGKALFKREGDKDRWCEEADCVIHKCNQPHALQTTDSPMLALVAWRNHLDTPPILVPAPISEKNG